MEFYPLGDEFLRESPYPIYMLPPIFREAIEGFCAKSLLPVNVVASSALFAAASAVQTVTLPDFSTVVGYGEKQPRWSAGLFFLTITDYGHQRKLDSDKTLARLPRRDGIVFTHWSLRETVDHAAGKKQKSVGLVTSDRHAFYGYRGRRLAAMSVMRDFCRFWVDDDTRRKDDDFFRETHLSVSFRTPFLRLASVALERAGDGSFYVSCPAERFLECFLVDFYDGPINLHDRVEYCDKDELTAFHQRMQELYDVPESERGVPAYLSAKSVSLWQACVEEYGHPRTRFLPFSGLASLHILRLAVVLSVFSEGFGVVEPKFVSAAHEIVHWHMINASKLGYMFSDQCSRWYGRRKPKIY